MAVYYIRTIGSDSNDGLTPATAWLSLTKALGAAGIASGDTVYIGAGIYRNAAAITVNMTSATAETFIIGDTDGRYTGDAGFVKITAFGKNDGTKPTTSYTLLNPNGKDFLTFRNLIFITNPLQVCVLSSSQTSTDIKFQKCVFNGLASSNAATISLIVGFGVQANWLIEKCIFLNKCATRIIDITLTTGSGSDYNTNIIIRDCFFEAGSSGINVTSSGSSSEEGGGVIVENCTINCASNGVLTTTTRVGGVTFTYPVIVKNCLMFSASNGNVVSAGELGAIVENYNTLYGTRSNVLAGSQSSIGVADQIDVEIGQSLLFFNKLKPFFSLTEDSQQLSAGDNDVTSMTDLLGNDKFFGNSNLLHNGTATSATESTITDSTKSFGSSNNLNGYTVKIVDGLGRGQTKTINGNTPTVISGDGLWITRPDSSSKYIVYNGPISTTSLVSSGSNITLTDRNASWGDNFWPGYLVRVTSGVASGESFIISGNSPTVLSGYSTFTTVPVSGDAYEISWGSGNNNSGINYNHVNVGCFARSDAAKKDVTTYLSGTNSIKLFNRAFQDFNVPVSSGASTTVSVWGYFNDHYSGTKPQLIIKDNPFLQVNAVTGVMVGASGQWEQISANFTPSGKGIVTARVQSNSTGIGGVANFDAFSIV